MGSKKQTNSRNSLYPRKNAARQRKEEMMQDIALERIVDLIHRAKDIFPTNPQLSNRYIELARNISMATKTPIPSSLKRNICHGCKQILLLHLNARVRIRHRAHYGSYFCVTCLKCGHITRYLFKGKACRAPFGKKKM